jgi:tRNA G37 N-methylase Trm5
MGITNAVRLAGILTLSLAAQTEAPSLDVPYVPTAHERVAEMLRLAGVQKGDVVYDLGCGDGRIVVGAAKLGARAYGFDIDPERIREARENAEKEGVSSRATFKEQNLFEVDVKDATVVTLYLLPSVNLKLRPKLISQLKPGSRIVSHSFDMGEWKPDKTVDAAGGRIYLWVIPKEKPVFSE